MRLAGQDTRRGTFSQRHSVLVDQLDEHEYEPLNHLSDDQAPFMVYDTVLSEYAALGFEYGYSIASDALVCWEAQFGDFANVAQVIIDQFVVAAADKWGQHSSLSLLLPHGFEGQGPEHSSARIERYLTLCAERNLRVVYPSTAAQYFHALRRQAIAVEQIPLVCFTPKRYLRMPQTRSTRDDLTAGAFEFVLDDRAELDRDAVTPRARLHRKDRSRADGRTRRAARAGSRCSGSSSSTRGRRLGSMAALDAYPNAREVWWVQEEPSNMGAWTFVHERLHRILRDRAELRHIARAGERQPRQRQHQDPRPRTARAPHRRLRDLAIEPASPDRLCPVC